MNITINRPALPATVVTLELTVDELRRFVQLQQGDFGSCDVTSALTQALAEIEFGVS